MDPRTWLLLVLQAYADVPVVNHGDSTESYLKQYGIAVEEHFITTKELF